MTRWMRLTACLAAALAAGSLPGCSNTAEKPPEPTKLQALPDSGIKANVLWTANVGASEGEPGGFRVAIDAEVVYTASESGEVNALSAGDGKRLWRAKLGKPLSAGPGLAADLVLVGTNNGEVLALDRRDGSERWTTRLSGEVLAPPRGSQGVVVVRCFDGRIYGLSADNGRRLWVQPTSVPTLSLRGTGGPVIVDGRVLVGLDNGKVMAMDLISGQVVWEGTVSVPVGRTELERLVDVDAEPVERDGMVYAVSYAGDLVAMDLGRGRVDWRAEVASITGLTSFLDWLYVSGRNGEIVAINRETGGQDWKQTDLLYREITRPAMHKGFVAVADLEGYVHWLSPQDGRILARQRALRGKVSTPPVEYNGLLYLLSESGRLVAVDYRTP